MASLLALYVSPSLTAGERVPEERVWAPWLPSQRHATREHGGGYLRQRRWEQRRLHILKRVYVQTRWTLTALMQSASLFLFHDGNTLVLWSASQTLSQVTSKYFGFTETCLCRACRVSASCVKICVVRLEPTRFFNQFISVVFCFSRSLYFCVFFFYLKTSVYILKQLNEPLWRKR